MQACDPWPGDFYVNFGNQQQVSDGVHSRFGFSGGRRPVSALEQDNGAVTDEKSGRFRLSLHGGGDKDGKEAR